jgi:hypothetical protein
MLLLKFSEYFESSPKKIFSCTFKETDQNLIEFMFFSQCCETVGNDFLRFRLRFRLWKSLGSVPAPVRSAPLRVRLRMQTIFSTVFHPQNIFYKILPFQCQKQNNFPESWPLIFYLFLLFYSILCWIRIHIRNRNQAIN